MLFQIIHADKCFAVDMSKVDIVQIEDSGELGGKDRYALCFYTIGIETAAQYDVSKLSIEKRIHLFEAVCDFKSHQTKENSKYSIPLE